MNRLEIENWLAGLPLSNQTKNHIPYTFRIVLRDAEMAGYIPFNVLEKIERFGDDAKKRDVFTLEELKSMFPDDYQKLIEIWGSLKHAVCYMILATTGIRTGEVRALCWRHNIAEGALLIEQAVKADDTIAATKTGDMRIVLLPSKAQLFLDDWRSSRENPLTEADDLTFFGADRNKPWSRDYLGKYLHSCMDRAGIKGNRRNLVCHSFRHTFNTIMRQVLPLEVLQALTGHKSESMTNLYDHPSIEDRLKKLNTSKELIESVWGY